MVFSASLALKQNSTPLCMNASILKAESTDCTYSAMFDLSAPHDLSNQQ